MGKLSELLCVQCATLLLAATVQAQQSIQPGKGQSPDQMQKDVAECQSIAQQSSGYNPAQASGQAASPPSKQRGGRARGAAAGAGARAGRGTRQTARRLRQAAGRGEARVSAERGAVRCCSRSRGRRLKTAAGSSRGEAAGGCTSQFRRGAPRL